MSEQSRFFAKVDLSGGPWSCWPWQAKLNDAGYGQFWPSRGVGVYAHRWAKQLNEAPGPVILPERSDEDAVALTIWESS